MPAQGMPAQGMPAQGVPPQGAPTQGTPPGWTPPATGTPQDTPAWGAAQQQPGWGAPQQSGWGTAQQPPGWGQYVPPPPPQPKGLARVGKIILIRVGVAAVAIAVVVTVGVIHGMNDDNSGGAHAYATISPPHGDSATSTAHANPNAPFEGTPAANYPEGADGITMPAAAAVSGFSTAQVKAALNQVHNALVAARLDSKMVVNRDPSAFLALVSGGERDDLRKDFSSDQFSTYATQVAPGHKLSKFSPRVQGRTTFRAATNSNDVREIEIITNYVWVYAFDEPASEPGDNLVVIHDTVTWDVPSTSDVEKSDQGLWVDESESYGSNVDCDEFDKGLIAPGQPQMDLGGGGSSTEDPDSMFDPDRSLDISNTC
ncbi:hypothetical protein [Rugosimonospora africana]|nr:hypothetical protein [Rugosimonospora africana]